MIEIFKFGKQKIKSKIALVSAHPNITNKQIFKGLDFSLVSKLGRDSGIPRKRNARTESTDVVPYKQNFLISAVSKDAKTVGGRKVTTILKIPTAKIVKTLRFRGSGRECVSARSSQTGTESHTCNCNGLSGREAFGGANARVVTERMPTVLKKRAPNTRQYVFVLYYAFAGCF